MANKFYSIFFLLQLKCYTNIYIEITQYCIQTMYLLHGIFHKPQENSSHRSNFQAKAKKMSFPLARKTRGKYKTSVDRWALD